MATLDGVLQLRWPAEAVQRPALAEAGIPRLWLVEGGAAPPEHTDCSEDWIRVPAPEADVRARAASLAARADRPAVDTDGVLRWRSRLVSLPPLEHRLIDALLGRYEAVVSREALARAGWPDGSPGRNALDVHVLRLRRRIAPLGLVIRTVRSRGYLLAAGEVSSPEAVANLA